MSWAPARRAAGILLVLAALFAVDCAALTYRSQMHPLFTSTDFSHHGWLAGRVVLGGGDPYEALAWLRTHWTPDYERDIGQEYVRGQYVFLYPTRNGQEFNPQRLAEYLYPLWMAYLFSVFALLPLFWALALFMLASEAAILLGLWCACRILRFRPPWYVGLLIVLLAAGFWPTPLTLLQGAYDGLVFGALLAAVLLIQRRQVPWLVGALLVFCTIKLQITVAILVFLGLWLLRQRRWRELGWAAGWGFLAWGLPTILAPGWIAEWSGMAALATPLIFAQPTHWSLWITIAGPYWAVAGVVVTALLALALVRIWWRDLATGGWDSLPLTLIFGLLLAVYAWEYDHILLLFPWLVCWRVVALADSARARLWRLILMGWLLLVPLYFLLPLDPHTRVGYGLVVPVSCLVLYLLAPRRLDLAVPARVMAPRLPARARTGEPAGEGPG